MENIPVNDQNLLIRPAAEHDAKSLAKLAADTFANTYAHILPKQDLEEYLAKAFSIEQTLKDIRSNDTFIFLASCSNALCGYTKWQPTPLPKPLATTHAIELVRLYVLAQWQSYGIGSILLDAGIETAKKKGYTACWLKVWEKNIKAINFYQKKGFVQAGDESYKVGSICRHVIVMFRPL